MSPRRAPRRDARPPRDLRRDRDGNLFDVDEHRPVAVAELADDVRAGRRFRVRHTDSGTECTQQVLLQVLASAALPTPRLGEAVGAARLPGLVGLIGSALTRAGDEGDIRDGRARVRAERRHQRERRTGPLSELGDEEAAS